MNRALQRLSLFTTGMMFLVVLMGAWVTNTGSADGCGPHWPLCKGTFMPEWDYEAIVEFSHRVVAAVAGLLVIILLVRVWRQLAHRRQVVWLAAGALFLVMLQGALGAMAVVWPQPKLVLALHFGISLMCFTMTLLVTVLLYRGDDLSRAAVPGAGELPGAGQSGAAVHTAFSRAVWGVAVYTFLVMYLGACVRHLHATLACTGWPLCNGGLVPTLYGPVGANLAHRLGAALAAVLVFRLWLLARRIPTRPDLRRGAGLALALMLGQVASGALFPLGFYNLLTQMLHITLIASFWGVLSVLCLQVLPARRRAPLEASA